MKVIAALALAAALLSPAAPASAQGRLPAIPTVDPGPSPRDELQSQFDEVKEISGNLSAGIAEAERRLLDVAGTSSSDLEAGVQQMFDELRTEVNGIIQQTSPTSQLRNALSRAREQALVFREDLQRRPPDHPNRDQNLARLDAAIAGYEELSQQIDERAEMAANALFQLSQQQNVIVEQIRLRQILRAQEALSGVVAGLALLAESIEALEPPSFEDAVIN